MSLFPDPYRYEIGITTVIGCRNACEYCPQEPLIKAYRQRSSVLTLTLDMFKEYLEKIPPYVELHFNGMSEPWLNPQCTDMVLYAHKRGHALKVYSTLVGMKPEDVDRLERVPYKWFTVHVPSDSGQEAIAVNAEYIEVVRRILRSDIGANFHFHSGDLHPALRELLAPIAGRSDLCNRGGNLTEEPGRPLIHRTGSLRCPTNMRANTLLPNGDIVLCCMDWGLKHVLGNLASSDYKSLFRGQEFKKVRHGLRNGSLDVLCRNCEWAEDFSLGRRISYNLDVRRYARAVFRLWGRR